MTVKELRDLLKTFPDNSIIHIEIKKGNRSNLVPAQDCVTIDAKTGDTILHANLEK